MGSLLLIGDSGSLLLSKRFGVLLKRRFSFFAAEEIRVAEEEIRVVEEEIWVAEGEIQFLCCRGDSCC